MLFAVLALLEVPKEKELALLAMGPPNKLPSAVVVALLDAATGVAVATC